MDFIAKKGDVLFVGEGENAFVVNVLNRIKFEENHSFCRKKS